MFARLGEKKKRHRARIKFLVADMGIDKFREAVLEERAKLPHDPRWTDFLATLPTPQVVVPGGTWQRTLPGTADALVSCVVCPEFDFADFELFDG